MKSLWGIFSLLPATVFCAGISYSVDFEGLDDVKALRGLRSSSNLVALRKKPPSSLNALRFRAESDIPDLVKVLHAHGYLEAEVDMKIEDRYPEYQVVVLLRPGPLYRIEKFQIHLKGERPNQPIMCQNLTFENVGIALGDPADTKKILDSELCALQLLAECGYPLATIGDREIIADGRTKRVKVFLTIDSGPLSHFGPTSIGGNESVKEALIEQQIRWCEGEPYESSLVECTQAGLMETGLFSSVYIIHDEYLDSNGQLPMKIEVCETKHRSISIGASFQTTYGAGATFGWENRNVGGMGRRILLQADIAQRGHSGIASFLIPNFYRIGQNYIIQAQAAQESIKPYRMQTYNLMNRFDRQVTDSFFFSIGAKLDYMLVSNSVDNGNFLLAEAPLFFRWTNVQDFLNPLSGARIEYWGTPAINIKDTSDFYYSQQIAISAYLPLWGSDRLVLAQKWTLGTIFSNGLDAVPVPKRFFGGSEEHLRGYKYYTVSPLEDDDKPIGGRSAIFYSLEPRFRLTESFGLVPFFDIGNVYLNTWPTFKGKWRKSAGIGLRYFSFIGPLRLDLAFPLNRREGIDPHWWIFVSLGQTF